MSKPQSASVSSRHRGPMGGRGPMGMMAGEKAKDFKGTFRKLIRYLGKYRMRILVVMIFAVASTVFMILGPKILGNATTAIFTGLMNMISGTGEGIDFGYIGGVILSLLGLYGVSALFSYLQGFLMTGVSMKVTYNLRNEIAQKINRMPLSYFDRVSHGEVISRVTNDVDTLSHSLNQSITQVITSVTTILGILVMMFSISWQLTLIALAIIPVSLIFVLSIVKHSQKYFKSQQEYLGHVNGHVEEMYGGHIVMKAFNGEEASVRKFNEFNETLYTSAWKSQFLSGLMMPVMNFIANLGYVAICILGGYFAVNRGLAVGDIQAFIQYVRQFTQPITQIANISNVLQQTAAAAERVFEFLDEEEEQRDVENPVRVDLKSETYYREVLRNGKPERETLGRVCGRVEFRRVHFGYTPDKVIINDFSARIEPGKQVAIVGPTGAGKTTMVKLLMRFYDINSGEILVDGHDLRTFARDDLRALFGMVLQDTWLYNASIRDNIRYGKLESSDEEVVLAAKAVQVHHFVRTLPDHYNMILNEEASNVSQGQKQLLTIARAVLADPKILILDEATSSVDTRTEVLIQKAMSNLMMGRTSFVIAHRLSTIRDADLILVMKDGDVVEQGRHEELLEKGGFYATLYNSQFEKTEAE